MPFVGRNSQSEIVAVAAVASAATPEGIDADAPELHAFLGLITSPAGDLARTDLALIRVVEDLIATLIDKNLLRFTDLPDAAQAKLLHRSSLRRSASQLDLLEDGSDTGKEIRL